MFTSDAQKIALFDPNVQNVMLIFCFLVTTYCNALVKIIQRRVQILGTYTTTTRMVKVGKAFALEGSTMLANLLMS